MTSNENALLAHFVSNTDRDVFALKNLPEEVAAVLFARYSRSAVGLREDLLQLLKEDDLEAAASHASDNTELEAAQEKARAFHEKYVVGYGHASVAEHAVVKLGIENVSIFASKLIEDARLASYTEKSTRYVPFDPSKACYPENVMASGVAGSYKETIRALMDAYTGWMDGVIAKIKERVPKTEKQTPRGYEAACRSTACDILRYLLPTATHTNIGATFNARTLETLISKLLSQPLPEGQRLGEEIKREAATMVPTLIKYAERNEYRAARPALSSCPDAPHTNCAHILPPFLGECDALSLIALPAGVEDFSLEAMLAGRGKHDPVPRELERVSLTFEIVMDFGAYRDVQRHRMATQITEPLSPAYGYEIPREIEVFGYAGAYRALMDQAAETYEHLVEHGFAVEAPYVLPLAYRVRTLFTANLRELFHFIELRSSRQGHPSYRNIAQQVYYEVERIYPQVARFIRVNKNEYALTRDEFRSRSWAKLVLGAAVVFAILVAFLLWSSKPPPGPPIVASPPTGRLYFLMVNESSEHTAALRGLYTLAAGEKKPQLVLEEKESQTMNDTPREWISFPRVSPDGKYLAYLDTTYFITEESQTEDVKLVATPLQGPVNPKVLLDFTAKKIAVPNGIAWLDNRISFLSAGSLVKVDPATGHIATIPRVAPPEAGDPTFIIWPKKPHSYNIGVEYIAHDGLDQYALTAPGHVLRQGHVIVYAASPPIGPAVITSDQPHQVSFDGRTYTLQWSEPWFYHGHVTSLGFSPDGKYVGYTVTNAIVPEEGFYFLRLSDGKCFRLPYSTSRAGWDWSR